MDASLRARLAAFAERIDTGISNPDTSRALVVFNCTDHFLSGTAVFHVDMSWPVHKPFPLVVVYKKNGPLLPSELTDWHEGPDLLSPSRKQLSFSLRFPVTDIPPMGWRTYIAAYVKHPLPSADTVFPPEPSGLYVIETLPHDGDLPPVGIRLLSLGETVPQEPLW